MLSVNSTLGHVMANQQGAVAIDALLKTVREQAGDVLSFAMRTPIIDLMRSCQAPISEIEALDERLQTIKNS
jgi:hypothetical protein